MRRVALLLALVAAGVLAPAGSLTRSNDDPFPWYASVVAHGQPEAVFSPSCKRDYYKNSSGKCVHRPSSDPSGATARCGDGSYSYSQHASGTCSHHGGVARWIRHP